MNRAALLLMLAAACGGSQGRGTTPEPTALDRLRERAAADANDAEAWSQLAEIELLGHGGDASRARETIDHALGLRPNAPSLHLLSAWEHDQHGRMRESFEALLTTIEKARTDAEERSPVIAEVALSDLADLRGHVTGYDERVAPLLERILAEPGRLGLYVVDQAAHLLMAHGYRQGEEEIAARAIARLGCLEDWRAVGPFGPHAMLTFDERQPAEAEGALADEYPLGPGRDTAETYEPKSRACRNVLTGPSYTSHAGGSTIVETFVEVEHGGRHLLSVSSGDSFKLYVDGELVHTSDQRRRLQGVFTHVPVDLDAGRHEIELKVTARMRGRTFEMILDRPGRLGEGWDPTRGDALPQDGEEHTAPLNLVLRTRALGRRGLHLDAREAIRGRATDDASAHLLLLRAAVAERDPYMPDRREEELTRGWVRQALARDPDAVWAAMWLAHAQQGAQERFMAIGALAERWPDVMEVQLSWANALRTRGQEAEAEAIVRRIREALPDECGPVRVLQGMLRARQRVSEANALVDDLMSCDATSTARLELLQRQRRWEEARAELARMEPLIGESAHRRHRLRIARASGDEELADRLQQEIWDEEGVSPQETLHRVDELYAAGQEREAIALLEREMDEHPAELVSLRSVRRDFTGNDDLEPYRVDGQEIIEAYESREGGDAEAQSQEGQVLVFDYMVTRIYEDGSARHLVHQIFKVQSEEGRQNLGQLSLPGQILTLHSIKPDGRRLEPEAISGLDSIPMTDLAIGDYVEYEYVRGQGPSMGGSFLSGGWSFDSYDEPFHFSQIVVLMPQDMELTVEAQGPVPDPEVSTEDGLKRMSWTMRDVPAREREPMSVPRPPFRPFLRLGWNAEWDLYFDNTREGLTDRDPQDPAVERLVREVLAGAESLEERITRLHSWTTENIQPVDAWGGVAPLMVAAKRGHRTRVLRYLLEVAGIDARFVISPRADTVAPGELVRTGLYQTVVIEVPREGGESLFLWAEDRAGDWRTLPQAIRGQEGIALVEGLPRVQVPALDPRHDRREVEAEVRVESDGSSVIGVVERSFGQAAGFLRSRLRQLPAADLPRMLTEGYVGRVLPGAEDVQIEVGGLDDPYGPLELRYVARVRNHGRVSGGRRYVPPMFPAVLARSLAPLPSRTTTQFVAGIAADVTMRISGPGAPRALRDVTLEAGGARYERRSRQAEGALVVERHLVVPMSYVQAEDYPQFAAWCRAVSEAEVAEVAVPLR